MGGKLVGTSRDVRQKQKKNVPPGSSTADIFAGSSVGLFVKERFRVIGKVR